MVITQALDYVMLNLYFLKYLKTPQLPVAWRLMLSNAWSVQNTVHQTDLNLGLSLVEWNKCSYTYSFYARTINEFLLQWKMLIHACLWSCTPFHMLLTHTVTASMLCCLLHNVLRTLVISVNSFVKELKLILFFFFFFFKLIL